MRQIKGQAIVEFVLAVWVFGLALSCFVVMSRRITARHEMQQALQLAMAFKSIPGFSDEDVEKEVHRFMAGGEINIRSFKDTPAAAFFNLKKVTVRVMEQNNVVMEDSIVFHEGGVD